MRRTILFFPSFLFVPSLLSISSVLAALCLAVLSFCPAANCASEPKPIYFDYQEFAAIKALAPEMEDARLCGLNKVCMRLWRDGEMSVPEHGMVVREDLDSDGATDVAVMLEKDKPKVEEGLDYFIIMANRSSAGWKLLGLKQIEDARSIVGAAWDAEKKGVAVDAGERHLVSESTVTMEEGRLIGGLRHHSGNVEIIYTYVTWNPRTKKFELRKTRG